MPRWLDSFRTQVTPWWAILVGSLGSGLLVALASVGAILCQQHQIGRREAEAARGQAYLQLLTHTITLSGRAHILMTAARLRSGLPEGLNVTFGIRPPVDLLQLHDWLASDMTPASEAWSAIWLSAPPKLVVSGNHLLACCVDVISAGTSRSERTPAQHLRELLQGAREDRGQGERLQRAVHQLALARRDFAALVRVETGQEEADLFMTGSRPTSC